MSSEETKSWSKIAKSVSDVGKNILFQGIENWFGSFFKEKFS